MKKSIALLAAAMLAGCGGRASTLPAQPTTTKTSPQSMTMRLTIPTSSARSSSSTATTEAARRAQYVSYATSGVLVQVYASTDVNHTALLGSSATDVSVNSPSCQIYSTERVCMIIIPAQPTPNGVTDDFVVTAYEQTPTTSASTPTAEFAGDTALSSGVATSAIIGGSTNTINVTLIGIPQNIAMFFTMNPTTGGSIPATATFYALDASKNQIVGAFSSPITVSYTDTSGMVTPSSNSAVFTGEPNNFPNGTNTFSFQSVSTGTACTMKPVVFNATVGGTSIGTATFYAGVNAAINDYTNDITTTLDITLRGAIAAAPTDGSTYTIGSSATTPQTIQLTSNLVPPVGSNIVICGAQDGSPKDLAVKGAAAQMVFALSPAGASNLTVRNLTLQSNSAANSGALWVPNGATTELDGVIAQFGANTNMYLLGSDGTLTLNHVMGYGTSAGGPIVYSDRTLTVTGSSFYGNTYSQSGAAISLNGGTTTITNSTFANNTGSGGAAIGGSGTVNVIASTFVDNVSTSSTGGGAIALTSGTLTTTNSIFAAQGGSSAGPQISGAATSGGYNVFDSSAQYGSLAPAATDKTGTIGAIAAQVYSSGFLELAPIPNTSSVAYDMIPAASCTPSTDGDYPTAKSRPLNGTTCSAGALEYSPTGSY